MHNLTLQQQQELYAELLIKIGINLQPGQSVRIGAELAHADFARMVTAKAYQAGARYVHVDWIDAPTEKARMLYSKADFLDFIPAYEKTRMDEMVDDTWARVALVGDEFPDIYENVDPAVMRKLTVTRMQRFHSYYAAQMAMRLQWTVAAVPTPAWAKKIFPNLTPTAAVRRLWTEIFKLVRVDQPDPVVAWRKHVQTLQRAVTFMADNEIRFLRFLDGQQVNGKPATDLTVGLTDSSLWSAGSAFRPDGLEFLPNMPTEEMFATPHNLRTEGWVRTSKPCFPLERRVENACFRFEKGLVTDFSAETGQSALEQFFEIDGSRRLGEVALVDVRSPVNRSGRVFFETLFDENAVCHVALGRAYTDIVKGAATMSQDERTAYGINHSDTHVDFMIGTPTMDVIGTNVNGQEIVIMKNGRFTSAVLAG